MASLYVHQDRNIAKTWLLVGVFFALVVGIGYVMSLYYQNPSILIVAVVVAVLMNIFSFWFSDRIVLSMAGARPAPDTEFPDLHNIVENLAITAGLPKPRLYIINDPAPNAFATGRNKERAVVAVTTGLLSTMTKPELEGVLAHELSHIGNRDMLVMTLVVVLAGFVAILSDIFLRMSMFGGGSRDNNRGGGLLAIIAIVGAILAPLAATLIRLAISRRREFLADASGALLTRYPEGLASALQKIGSYSAPMKRANNATAHLYISNPFGAKLAQGIAKLFMTHPPIEERVRALRGES